jgi:hypothetical protein
MATLNIPEDTFARLSRYAAAIGISVEQLILPLLAQAVPPTEEPLTGDAWAAELDAWKHAAAGRAGRYPPGFVLDDSRDGCYRDRLDGQL